MTQKEFYKTRAWRRARDAYIAFRLAIDGGLCEVCGKEPGFIVHHKIWLNDENCNDPNVALSDTNFRYECQTCHNRERNPEQMVVSGRCRYGPDGEIIRNTDY